MRQPAFGIIFLFFLAAITIIVVGQAQELAHLKLACAPELRGSL